MTKEFDTQSERVSSSSPALLIQDNCRLDRRDDLCSALATVAATVT